MKRQFMANEFGKKQYLQGLASKKEGQVAAKVGNVEDRKVADEQFEAFQQESVKQKFDIVK